MTLTEGQKKQVAAKQNYQCANKPGANLPKLENYLCPMWQIHNNRKGVFDESQYEIDHIIEQADGGTDHPSNLQALCASCHSTKTKRFMIGRRKLTNKNKHYNPTYTELAEALEKLHKYINHIERENYDFKGRTHHQKKI